MAATPAAVLQPATTLTDRQAVLRQTVLRQTVLRQTTTLTVLQQAVLRQAVSIRVGLTTDQEEPAATAGRP